MGIMMSNDMDRDSELNRRITSDLRARAQSTDREDPDYVDDSNYVKDLKKTNRFGWVWAVLIVLAIISLVCIIII